MGHLDLLFTSDTFAAPDVSFCHNRPTQRHWQTETDDVMNLWCRS